MSQAVHVGTDYANQYEFFECPRCGARQKVSPFVWRDVEVLGPKPTLDVCEHEPHIPPSPSAIAAFERSKAILDLLVAIAADSGSSQAPHTEGPETHA